MFYWNPTCVALLSQYYCRETAFDPVALGLARIPQSNYMPPEA